MKYLTDDIFVNFEKYKGLKVKSPKGIIYTIYEISEGDILLVTNKISGGAGFTLYKGKMEDSFFSRAINDGYCSGMWILNRFKGHLGKSLGSIYEIIEGPDNISISEKELNLLFTHLNFKLLNP